MDSLLSVLCLIGLNESVACANDVDTRIADIPRDHIADFHAAGYNDLSERGGYLLKHGFLHFAIGADADDGRIRKHGLHAGG